MPVRIVHAADLHLDSAFGALTGEQARLRRREGRELLTRIGDYANRLNAELVLLAGDLFDSEITYRETIEQLRDVLASVRAQVFIAPGNHDFYSAKSPYATLRWPENVHIFRSTQIERVELPELSCAVYGAAFTAPSQSRGLLAGFAAPDDGLTHIMVLHGDLGGTEPRYNLITREQIERSNLDYLALGHKHLHDGFHRAGRTVYAYAGCPEGRGFDEPGEKGILCGEVGGEKSNLKFLPTAKRRYQLMSVDITGDAESALRGALPEDCANDLLRVTLTGETDERGLPLARLYERFSGTCFHLELCDATRIAEDVWARAQEDSLRGLFLRELQQKLRAATSDAERAKIEAAARLGLAALDRRDI